MKLQDVYKNVKSDNLLSVVLIKSGTFFVTYDNDAYILAYLFGYQVNDNKVGFPKSSVQKVMDMLNEYCISYINADEGISEDFDDNRYEEVLYKAKRNYYDELNRKLLIDEISFLIKSNPDNIAKIRSFINGL